MALCFRKAESDQCGQKEINRLMMVLARKLMTSEYINRYSQVENLISILKSGHEPVSGIFRSHNHSSRKIRAIPNTRAIEATWKKRRKDAFIFYR
jgi:hypothetical protein